MPSKRLQPDADNRMSATTTRRDHATPIEAPFRHAAPPHKLAPCDPLFLEGGAHHNTFDSCRSRTSPGEMFASEYARTPEYSRVSRAFSPTPISFARAEVAARTDGV